MKSNTRIIIGSVLALAIAATEPARAMGHTESCNCMWDPVQTSPQTTIASKSNILIGTGLLFGLALIPLAWRRVGGRKRAVDGVQRASLNTRPI